MHRLHENTVDADGFCTHYWEAVPDGTPRGTVVLVHDGAFGSDAATSWGEVIRLLGDDHRVLAPDLIGFGDSDKAVYLDRSPYVYRAAHLAAFCTAVGVGTGETGGSGGPGNAGSAGGAGGAHFVGHSFGGSLVLRALASATPSLPARSGVSISGSGGPWRSPPAVAELGRFDGTEKDMRRLLDLMVDDYPGLDRAVQARYANTRKPGHVETCLSGRLKHPDPPVAPPAAGAPWPEALRECPVPLLVVAGDRDPLMEPGWTDHFADLSPRVSVRHLDAKHAPNMDRPDEIAALLLDFFAAQPSAAPAAR
ncbi:alpha/beta fold hydrolase [Streptomyces sp. NPDC050560]|uniref:alpha/beta fold hydrolase n=1 Tax=Streptomyces sp. NPDC050560 TaxID=3365630 RepID=UPI0037BE11E6